MFISLYIYILPVVDGVLCVAAVVVRDEGEGRGAAGRLDLDVADATIPRRIYMGCEI